MREPKNKKGFLFIIPIIIAGILLFIVATKLKPILFAGVNSIPDSVLKANEAANRSLFSADNVTISDGSIIDGTCNIAADSSITCKAGKDVSFTTSVYNGGTKKRLFYGGIAVCPVRCRSSGVCAVTDKTCFDKIYSSPKECSVLIGSSTPCESPSYAFSQGTFNVYPVATCLLDNTYGCSGAGLTEAPRYLNELSPLRIHAIQ